LALREFRLSADACSAREPALLAKRLYWLAVALLRLDRRDLAIKSLASAQKLRPRGPARAAYVHRVNGYGMIKRQSPEVDDFYAFFSVQACRYLGSRPGQRFVDASEKDAITRIIASSWRALKDSHRLEGQDPAAKLRVFQEWRISFPGLIGSRSKAGACREPIQADFRKRRSVSAEDRCPCGSGLAYMLCCGRTKSPCELQGE
jgi:hypothetical protein